MKYSRVLYSMAALSVTLLMFTSCTVTIKNPPANSATDSPAATVAEAEPTAQTPELESPAPAGSVGVPPSEKQDISSLTPETAPGMLHEAGVELLDFQTGRPQPDSPDMVFALYGKKDSDGYFEQLILRVTDPADGKELIEHTVSGVVGDMSGACIWLADANFDGATDVLFTEGATGSHGHISYYLLLWEAGAKSFSPIDSFAGILNPVFDAKDQIVRSLAADSAFEEYYEIYIFEPSDHGGVYRLDKKLVLTCGDPDTSDELTGAAVYETVDGVFDLTRMYGTDAPNPLDPNDPYLYGPDSVWKLNDPIWYEGVHYKGANE